MTQLVVNYDLPGDSKTYVHRVGRTARAGKSGRSISIVTQVSLCPGAESFFFFPQRPIAADTNGFQYDVEIFKRIEAALGEQQKEYPTEKEEVFVFKTRVEEAQRHARNEMKNLHEDRGKKGAVLKGRRPAAKSGKRGRDDMDAEEG